MPRGKKNWFSISTEHGGRVVAMGKDGKPMVGFRITEFGGYFQVDGNSEGSVAIGINEYGDVAVTTWDKNGNRQ